MKKVIVISVLAILFTLLLVSCNAEDGMIGNGSSGTVTDNEDTTLATESDTNMSDPTNSTQ